MALPKRIIANRYELHAAIGEGAMGHIWKATDRHLRRPVALKLMAPAQATSALARNRFALEAMAIARLCNQHVVQIHDYGFDEDNPYIVMELLQGEDLEARLRRAGRLPLSAVITILNQASRGLAAAHDVSIVHRDLKPANLFLARTDVGEVVKILDFGVASMLGNDINSPEDLVGRPLYMSPEQVRCAQPDLRSDLWSLAVVAYYALTGSTPFQGQHLSSVIMNIAIAPFPAPSSLVPDLSPKVDRFFERALAKNPAQRFSSAREMAAAFAALADPQDRGPVKILVVDDEPDVPLLVRQRFRQQIRKSVYEFVFATDGETALEQLRNHPDVNVVLSDISMPGMDGLTFLSRVAEVNPMVQTVMVSAYGDMRNIRTAMNRGAFDFVVKPIDFEDLEATIQKSLRRVAELRKTARSTEENDTLRMFVSSSLVERIRSTGTEAGQGEDWQGTVAFIDLAGFHPAAGEAPPGDALRTLNANFEVMVPEITRRGGVIDKFLGDAVMTIFRGEGHLGRALDACMAVRDQLHALALRTGEGSPFAHGVSIGVDTGPMIAGEIGSRAFGRLDYTVLGEIVGTAAHLKSIARKDQVLVTGRVAEAARSHFEFEAQEDRRLPQNGEPISVFELVRRRIAPQAAATTSAAYMTTLAYEEQDAKGPGQSIPA
ncbi:protein kinase domain-containing protein [Polyangium aurulentum]|uniref:protein kinase domain-containing protein n=1 Tax=Polyangium aurulentum TaxID=2567896 RepID=UPI00200D5609|nr:protein kinase [Polyangium aurulentum]UQA57520.1 protein kinase [Polyangium aurulentum]